MAEDDHALVVGVTIYPDQAVGSLDGAERDARAFRDWLVDPAGGAVPEHNVALVTSSLFHPPAPAGVFDAKPRVENVTEVFDKLQDLAQAKPGNRIGRRLYLFFAGHGLVCKFAFQPLLNDAGLLMANATRKRAPHVLGRVYATYFLNAGMFDEVALFMDCCRDIYPGLTPDLPQYIDFTSPDEKTLDRGFYAFATQWSRTSREKIIDGESRGVFTTALLRGLRGAAADTTGAITSSSLGDYLMNHMRDLLTPEEIADPDIPEVPDIAPTNHEMTFATVAPPRFDVVITVPAAAVGKEARVRNHAFEVVAKELLKATEWKVTLPRGLYLFDVAAAGIEKPFRAEAGNVAV